MKFYDGNNLLHLKDSEGNTPEIFIVDGNRASGKTTYFNKKLVNDFIKYNKKFCLLYRYNYELDQVADKFFKDIKALFFPQYEMTEKSQSKGIYHELYIKNVSRETNETASCGYAIALNNSDQIKKMSHLFSDCSQILFDEFQSETMHYCPNEIQKFLSIHTSLARGHGEQSKYLPVYMLSNSVSSINPYYSALGISERLRENTRFLRGKGFVLERNFNPEASKALKQSTFNSAFSKASYLDYAASNSYLKDSATFIEKVEGKGRYLFTLKSSGREFGVIEYPDQGIIYVTDRADSTFKTKIAVDLEDHDVNYVLLSHYDSYISRLSFLFERGSFRFKNQLCKNALLRLLNYDKI